MAVSAVLAVCAGPAVRNIPSMEGLRRSLAAWGAGLALLAAGAVHAQAPAFPTRPVRILVANTPGSSPDIVTRIVAARMQDGFNRGVLVENRAGASGLIAAEAVARSPADGYTLLQVTLSQLVAGLMYQRFQLATEFSPVGLIGTTPFAIAVNAALPVSSVAEFVAYAKARPGQLMYGSTGQWGSLHLCIEIFNEMAGGLAMTHVPYAGTPQGLNALMTGEIALFCPAAPAINALARSGKIKALGVTYTYPTRLLPGVPPVAETVSGFSLPGWYALQTTAKTPAEVVGRLNAELVRSLKLPDVQEKLLASGTEAAPGTAAEFQAFLNSETERYGKVLRDRNAKPEPLSN